MVTRLDAIEKRRLSARDAVYWGDNQALVDYVLETDMPLLMSVAEAAAAYLVADKAWKDVRDDDDMDEDEVNDLWRAETDAYIALEAAIEPLMEEVRECH